MPWLAGYASIIAGIFTLAYFPAVLVGGWFPAILIGLSGLAQVFWGAMYILRQSRKLVALGLLLQSAALTAAFLGALPDLAPPWPAWPTATGLRLLAGLIALAAVLAAPPAERAPGSPHPASAFLRATGLSLGGALLVSLLWLTPVRTNPPSWIVSPPPTQPALTATPEPGAHAEPGDSHQATFRVRITRQRAGPFIVDAFTGPVEVGNLFVEVRVTDDIGRPVEGLKIGVEARPSGAEGDPVAGTATMAQAEVPGDYAVSLPVTSAGFWEVVVRIGEPEDAAQVAFSERVGGTTNVAGWVLAGVPLAVALLFGLVYLRTAGRGRS